jgi:alkylation response protein AidB-like acyl-CoA dehydrogenase
VDIELTPADLQFQHEVRAFLADHVFEPGTDEKQWRQRWFAAAAAKGGWDVPRWPREFGGPGWTAAQHHLWDKETAAHTLPADSPFGVTMLAPILMAYGTPEQQQRFLPAIRARSVQWCQGYSEPGAGSDLAALKTRAVLSGDGSHYVVTGTKIWTSAAHLADWMFCLTRTSEGTKRQQGITFLLIPMRQPGIEVRPIITLGGRHHVNMVHLTDVAVPVGNRIGKEGEGWTYAKGLLQHERVGIANISRSSVALAELKQEARQLPCGAGVLLDDPSYRLRLAAVEVDLMALEFTELRSVAAISSGGRVGPESSILKLKGTEIQQAVSELAVDLGGPLALASGAGDGQGDDSDIAEWARVSAPTYLNLRKASIYGGSNEIQRQIIAGTILGL